VGAGRGHGHQRRPGGRQKLALLAPSGLGGPQGGPLRRGEGAFRVLARVVYMAQEAKDDGFARNPGAYAQGLLRREGYWDLVNPFQAFKVGVVA